MTTSLSHDSRDLAETYDRLSDVQFESGKRLAEQLDVSAGERVIDVGSGTVVYVMRSLLQLPPYAENVDLSQLVVASSGMTSTELISLVVNSPLRLACLYVKANARTHASGEEAVAFLESSSFGNLLRV